MQNSFGNFFILKETTLSRHLLELLQVSALNYVYLFSLAIQNEIINISQFFLIRIANQVEQHTKFYSI